MATQGLYRFSLVTCIISFLFMMIAFSSPFWYQSWTRVHSSFGNIGLWQVCLNGFIMPRDPVMKSYVGCWWIHSSEFDLVKDDIQPVWFRFVQGFSVLTVLAMIVAAVIMLIFFPRWRSLKLMKYRIKLYFVASGFLLGSAFMVFLIALVFAEMSNDSSWMPRPWMNYLSWSYGLCVVSGFFAAFSGMSLFILALIYKEKELNGDPELTAAAEAVAKRRELEKQDELMRQQQGGISMSHIGPRTPHGSGQIYRPGQYQHQPAVQDRPDFRKYGGYTDPPPVYGSQQRLPPAPHSVAGSQVSKAGSQASKAGSQGNRPSESFV